MPPRISRSSAPKSTNPKGSKGYVSAKKAKKAQSRSLNAFAIASHEHPDEIKIRQHRLGESDLGHSHRKRQRDEEDEDEEEEEEGPSRRKQKKEKGRFDELDLDEGSDSEGNQWTLGHVDEDDDEDIDSDEAFGESDEERFEGWVFRGSARNRMKSKPKKREREPDEDGDFDLNEDDSADEGDDDEESLGEDAVDLATMLDQYEGSDEEAKPKKTKKKQNRLQYSDSEDAPSEEGYSDDDGASDFSMSDEDDNDPSKIAQLKNLISSLPAEEEEKPKGPRGPEVHESGAPSEFGVFRKVDLAAFKPKSADREKKKALKLLQDDSSKPSKRNSIARKLDAPLPKRQQDKLDRAAATEKANETLGRWVDTVKHNRRAEHISFPLQHPNAGESMGESRLIPTQTIAPANELESTIQSILQESGLSAQNGQDEEDQLAKWETLQTNKLPLEEVMARRAELRKQRDLMFREELRAKRIKKIKSKAYRRVHRKERERIAEREREALIADGVDLSEEEREYNDRRRAEERMGAKHRDSKWVKGMKKSGRTVWDEDARSGVTEMARRNEELRRRMEGKEVHDDDEEPSDFSSEEDDDEDEDENTATQRMLGKLKQNPFSTSASSKLGEMSFMQKAEAAQKARNDEAVEQMQRELAGEETNSEDEDGNGTRTGRRKFGPGTKLALPNIPTNRLEFEEQPPSDEENEAIPMGTEPVPEDAVTGLSNGTRKAPAPKQKKPTKSNPVEEEDTGSSNPYLRPATKTKEKKKKALEPSSPLATHNKIEGAKAKAKGAKSTKKSSGSEPVVSAPDADGWQTVTYGDQDDEDDEDDIENDGIDLEVFTRNQALTAKGFAGDDVEAEFAAEKKAVAEEEDDKIVDETLPGWGSWAGEGLSQEAQRRNRENRKLVLKKGIKAHKRKDAKLERVIINEKRAKANTKFLATSLPFPYETREQYERSLRLPKGPEWTTKQTFQDATKPRVLVKQGIIRPMSKPLM